MLWRNQRYAEITPQGISMCQVYSSQCSKDYIGRTLNEDQPLRIAAIEFVPLSSQSL